MEEPALFGDYDEVKEKPGWGRDSPPAFPQHRDNDHPTPISWSRAGGAAHTISREEHRALEAVVSIKKVKLLLITVGSKGREDSFSKPGDE